MRFVRSGFGSSCGAIDSTQNRVSPVARLKSARSSPAGAGPSGASGVVVQPSPESTTSSAAMYERPAAFCPVSTRRIFPLRTGSAGPAFVPCPAAAAVSGTEEPGRERRAAGRGALEQGAPPDRRLEPRVVSLVQHSGIPPASERSEEFAPFYGANSYAGASASIHSTILPSAT